MIEYLSLVGSTCCADLCIIYVRFDPGANASLSGDRKAQGVGDKAKLVFIKLPPPRGKPQEGPTIL